MHTETLRQTYTHKHIVGNCNSELNAIDINYSKYFFVETTTQTHILHAAVKHTLVHAWTQTKQTGMLHGGNR